MPMLVWLIKGGFKDKASRGKLEVKVQLNLDKNVVDNVSQKISYVKLGIQELTIISTVKISIIQILRQLEHQEKTYSA